VLKPLTKKQGKFPSFFNKVPFIYLFFEILDFMTCNDGKEKHDVEEEYIKIWWMKGREIKIKYANGGRRAENKI
jgi:hypothetical protein